MASDPTEHVIVLMMENRSFDPMHKVANVLQQLDGPARSFRAMESPADAGAVAAERATRFLTHLNEGLLPTP
jgi:phospholipase C